MEKEAILKAEPNTVVIRPTKGWMALNLRDLWHYRELIYFMTWRDLKVRYKQTLLGVSWAVLNPFLNMVVFSIFFGGLAKMPSDGIPYPIFSYVGLLPWGLFANALLNASRSLYGNQNMVSKVYFPRLVLAAFFGAGWDGGFWDCLSGADRHYPVLQPDGDNPPDVHLADVDPAAVPAYGAGHGVGSWLCGSRHYMCNIMMSVTSCRSFLDFGKSFPRLFTPPL